MIATLVILGCFGLALSACIAIGAAKWAARQVAGDDVLAAIDWEDCL